MIGKILAQLIGNASEDQESAGEEHETLREFEDEGWVIVNLPEDGLLSAPDGDLLENLLIEHPSMSVYQMRRGVGGAEEEEPGSDEEETSRPVAVRRHVSWRLAAWGLPLLYNIQLPAAQRGRSRAEGRKLSRGALHRQNLTKTRFCPAERRYGHFKQPCQRLYNY
ncbi:tumor protein p53-inducible nuclear protein 1 [Pundamilia nyererei]|uniref:Tumor protein p53-inducible nuclear protein 1-like n=1 Tax=Pundamilia nyererei TaxID=303518 RepID=A0A3B4GZN3_9CICH|nr:PREDICTED: tumor protein p53-inducible nuclear protein 1-like [Pundamilia nyererei]XP_005726475.1 PREDICTED: tumor protein p53-inducible nuclear protein 1-like [Pundamilia nyererei]